MVDSVPLVVRAALCAKLAIKRAELGIVQDGTSNKSDAKSAMCFDGVSTWLMTVALRRYTYIKIFLSFYRLLIGRQKLSLIVHAL